MSAKKSPALVSIPAGTPARTCSGCGATIYWVVTDKGARAPVHVNTELAPKSAAPGGTRRRARGRITMDNITLAWLTEADACFEACTAFVNVFGEAGTPTPHEVFTAAAKLNRRGWTVWLLDNIPGILSGLSITDGPIKTVDSGTIEVNDGHVYASDSATVEASDSATVEASDSATVYAYGSATVYAYGSATVYASDSATVYAYGSATVRAYGSATVEASDSATVLLNRYSTHVTLNIYGPNACAVDRRDGQPRLILADATE